MIPKDKESILSEIIKNDIEEVHLAQWVDKINSHNHLDRRLLIFSDSGFALCRPKAFSKVPEITKFFSWFNLQSIELNDNTFKFSFNGNDQDGRSITFSYDQITELLDVLCQHLANILIPSEYPKVLAGANFSIKNYISVPMISGISRLKANIFFDNEVNDEIRSLIDSYTNFLNSGMTKLNLGLFGESHFIGYVIDSLNVVPHVTSIEFPSTKSSSSHWLEFCDLIRHSRYIKKIITHEKITSDFAQINLIQKNEISKVIESIVFGNLGLKDEEVSIISNLYKKSKFKSIKFLKARTAMCSLKLNLSSFLSNSNFKSITLDKISSINVLTTLSLFRNVEHVGITGCGIEISEAIPVICSLDSIIHIKSINLSWNISNFLLSKTNISLPNCIEEIYLDNVKFKGVTLQAILAFFECQKSPTKLSLHLNNIVLDADHYQSLFKFAQNYIKRDKSLRNSKSEQNQENPIECFNLHKIYWDSNQINKPLLQFFTKNSHLSLLSLNGTDLFYDDQVTNGIINLIKRTKSLNELNIAGNLRYQLQPEKLELILQSFANDQRSIKRLNISMHEYRPETMNVLSDVLMANRSINYVDFTGNGILKKSVWKIFFKKLLRRGTPLELPIPQAEFCEMLKSKEITKDEIIDLLRIINALKKGNKDIKIPPETINPAPLSNNVDDIDLTDDENENDDIKKKFSFEITEIPVPDIDNSMINDSFEKEFGMNSLFEKLKT